MTHTISLIEGKIAKLRLTIEFKTGRLPDYIIESYKELIADYEKAIEVLKISSNNCVSGELPNCIDCFNNIESGDKYCKHCGYEQDKKFGNLR